MHISFIIVEISKIFGKIGNLVSFIIVGKHKPIRGTAGTAGAAWAAQQKQMAQAFVSAAGAGASDMPALQAAPADQAGQTAQTAPAAKNAASGQQAILVATHTCPNCGAAKKMLEKAGIDYRVVYADEKEGASFAERHSIIQAPTLLMPEEDSYRKLTNIGEISGYLKKQPVA